jgi:hypothetical protein
VGQSAPFLSVLILWAANPKDISWSRRDTRLAKRENHRGPRFWIARSGLPGIPRDQTPRSWPKNCVLRLAPPIPGGSEEGEFRTRGTRFSEFPTEGSR